MSVYLFRFLLSSLIKEACLPDRQETGVFFSRHIRLLLYFLLPSSLSAQDIPVGTWRTHASYQSLQTLAVAGERVYAAYANGFFYYDQSFSSTTTLSKLDGFSEAEVGRLAYDETTQTLIVAYQNGNIDLVRNNEITNVNELAASSLVADKQINHVLVAGNAAYVSGNFGVVVLNVASSEIRETYRNLGAGGAALSVNASVIVADTLFLATSQGLLAAPATGVNLQDFNNWQTVPLPDGFSTQPVQTITSRNEILYAVWSGNQLYAHQNQTWQPVPLPTNDTIHFVSASAEQILIGVPNRIYSLTTNNQLREITHPLIQQPQEATYDGEGNLWIADAVNGLLRENAGNVEAIVPDGPANSDTWQLLSYEQNMLALPGGYDNAFNPLNQQNGFDVFTPVGWENYRSSAPELARRIPPMRDLVSATYNPADGSLYIGSFGEGLLASQPDGSFQVFNSANSPLQTSANGLRITGLATDDMGNVWLTVYGADIGKPTLYVRKADNTWQSIVFNNNVARFPVDVIIDDLGYKWLMLQGLNVGGIWVFDEQANRSRYLTSTTGQGGLPSANVRSLTKDRQGQLWVGTDRGVAFFLVPGDVFEANSFDAFTPIFDGRRLLQDETVSCIAVDGGNRKWMGTNNGAWLFSPEGDELIHHFTTQNSPLPSDVIADIAIQPVTGEVFIATDKGIISYRGTATGGNEQHTEVTVFPNPVRPGFEGVLSISGLVMNAIVKITDVSGRLVYETRSQGGTATWGLRDYTGRRAATGIYLIYSADESGQETFVTKFAVVR